MHFANKTIFDQKLFSVDDKCFALYSSITNPHLYLRFKCIVKNVIVNDDKVVYYVEIIEVLENIETIQIHMHLCDFRFFHKWGNRKIVKNVKCFDLLNDMSSFSSEFTKRYDDVYLIIPNILISDTLSEITDIFNEANSIMSGHLTQQLKDIKGRIS